MTSYIEKIYDDFIEDFKNKPDFIIDFYTKNSLLLNNIETFKDKDELRLYIEITFLYINAVYQKNRFNETIDSADRNLKLIDSEISRLIAYDLKDDLYNGILHFKGMSAYRLRDYKISIPIYKYLTTIDNKNDNFKNWLNYSLYGQKLWLVNTIYFLSGLLILIYLLAKEYIESSEIRISILIIGFLGLTSNYAYEYYINRSFRKTSKQ